MAAYIVLINFTDQGIRNVKQIPERRKAGIAAAEKLGIKVKEAYWTVGAYDAVVVADAPNDEVMTTWALIVDPRATSARRRCGPTRPTR